MTEASIWQSLEHTLNNCLNSDPFSSRPAKLKWDTSYDNSSASQTILHEAAFLSLLFSSIYEINKYVRNLPNKIHLVYLYVKNVEMSCKWHFHKWRGLRLYYNIYFFLPATLNIPLKNMEVLVGRKWGIKREWESARKAKSNVCRRDEIALLIKITTFDGIWLFQNSLLWLQQEVKILWSFWRPLHLQKYL